MKQKIIAALVLIDFVALNAYAIYHYGLGGLFDFLQTTNAWGITVFADLVIALCVVLGWMWADSRGRGEKPVALTVVTLLTGSIGPLLYIITRRQQSA